MCQPVTCQTCGKTTWAGCGEHVDEVKKNVPEGQWCTCDRAATGAASGGSLPR